MSTPPEIMINLLEVDKKRLERQKFAYITIVIIIALLGSASGIYFSAFNEYKQQMITNRQLKSQLASYHNLTTALDVVEKFQNQVASKRNSVSAIESQKISYTAIMEEIARAVPTRVKLIGVEMTQVGIIINGYSPDHENVAKFLSGLRNTSFFYEVRLVFSELDKESGEVRFVIENSWGGE
jgi:Tfp pilus assembly protein PilN